MDAGTKRREGVEEQRREGMERVIGTKEGGRGWRGL